MLASAFHSCPSTFGHFFCENFKRHSQKWILKQQVPLNIPKHSTKITCQCTNPFRHLVGATPKTTRKPFRGHGRRCRPRQRWPPQRSAARPRRHGRYQLRNAGPSCLGAEDATRTAGQLRLPSRNKAIVMGCFSGWLGKIIGHKYQICQADAFRISFGVRHGEKKRSNHRKICSCTMVLFKSYKQFHLTFAASCVTCQKDSS